jgi:hypothetical protein
MTVLDLSSITGQCKITPAALLGVLSQIETVLASNSMLISINPFPGNPVGFPQTRTANITNPDANRIAKGFVFATCSIAVAQVTAQRTIGHRLTVDGVEVGQHGLDPTGTEPGWNCAIDTTSTTGTYLDRCLPLILAAKNINPGQTIALNHLVDLHPVFSSGSDSGKQSESTIIGFIGGY